MARISGSEVLAGYTECVHRRRERKKKKDDDDNGRGNVRSVYIRRRQNLQPRVQHASYIWRDLKIGEERTHVRQLCVVWIVEPRRDRHGIVRMENI